MPREIEIKPHLIAFSSGLTIIPFRNITAVSGDEITKSKGPDAEGIEHIEVIPSIMVLLKGLNEEEGISLIGDDADKFIKDYNHYLRLIELDNEDVIKNL